MELSAKPARPEWRAHTVARRCEYKSPAASACTELGSAMTDNHRPESASRAANWRRGGTERFLGRTTSARARAACAAPRLILMGDWCALGTPQNETPGATRRHDGA